MLHATAGDVIATYHYREAEIEKAPAIVGETALLAGSEGQYSVRPCGYRYVLHHLPCSSVDGAAVTILSCMLCIILFISLQKLRREHAKAKQCQHCSSCHGQYITCQHSLQT